MKITLEFEGELSFKNFAYNLAGTDLCPNNIGLKEDCVNQCNNCWYNALKEVVEE